MKIDDLKRESMYNHHVSVGSKKNSKPRKVTLYHPLAKWNEAARASCVMCLINEYGCDPNTIKVDKKIKPDYVVVTGMSTWTLGRMLDTVASKSAEVGSPR